MPENAVNIRSMTETDLSAADHVCRLAFGTFLQLPDPMAFMREMPYVATRWRADSGASFVAERDGEVVGSILGMCWGSVGVFGPLTVHPDLSNQGVAQRLIEPMLDLFAQRGVRHAGLFTFGHSAKHLALYQRFGYWPRFLTALMSRPVGPTAALGAAVRLLETDEGERHQLVEACRALTDSIYPGLDLSSEIRSVVDQRLGEVVVLQEGSQVTGMAICHCGAGSEAGPGACYVKFGVVHSGALAERDFSALLDACEGLAAATGAERLAAGMNTARHEAYTAMLSAGFRTDHVGVAMHRPNEPGYCRPGVFAIDDWR